MLRRGKNTVFTLLRRSTTEYKEWYRGRATLSYRQILSIVQKGWKVLMGNDLGMQYIMDGNGNYYTVNNDEQLVVARDREEAGVFTFYEANQRIGGGKQANFFVTIPVEDSNDNENEMIEFDYEEEDIAYSFTDSTISKVLSIYDRMTAPEVVDEEKKEIELPVKPSYEYSMENTDWSEFVKHFIFLTSGAKVYREELIDQLGEVGAEICDLLHYVELYDLKDEEGLKAMDMLKDARQRRRDLKDNLARIEFFSKMLGTSTNLSKAKGFLTEMKKLDTRKYFPRQLKELFEDMPSDRATDRALFRQNRANRENKVEEEYEEICVEEEKTEMSYVETVFDNKENDWLGFAKQQKEFYQNVGQYMNNLEIEIEAIDTAIEEIMEKIENANYNVTQGYKVFKELKDLRNERKEKVQELKVLRTMTECFDINSMVDALAYNVDEIEKITASVLVDSVEQGVSLE